MTIFSIGTGPCDHNDARTRQQRRQKKNEKKRKDNPIPCITARDPDRLLSPAGRRQRPLKWKQKNHIGRPSASHLKRFTASAPPEIPPGLSLSLLSLSLSFSHSKSYSFSFVTVVVVVVVVVVFFWAGLFSIIEEGGMRLAVLVLPSVRIVIFFFFIDRFVFSLHLSPSPCFSDCVTLVRVTNKVASDWSPRPANRLFRSEFLFFGSTTEFHQVFFCSLVLLVRVLDSVQRPCVLESEKSFSGQRTLRNRRIKKKTTTNSLLFLPQLGWTIIFKWVG